LQNIEGETIPSFGLATIMSIGDELKVVDSNSLQFRKGGVQTLNT